jgi:hypothetical protein
MNSYFTDSPKVPKSAPMEFSRTTIPNPHRKTAAQARTQPRIRRKVTDASSVECAGSGGTD